MAIEIFVIAAIGAALGLLGPFDTFAIPAGQRILLWIGVVLAGYAIYRPIQTAARWLSEETLIAPWIALLIAGAIASLPLSFVVGFVFAGMRYVPELFGEGFPVLYAQVLGITIVIQVAMHFLLGPRDAEAAAPEKAAPPPPKPLSAAEITLPDRPDAPFFERLPPELGTHLVCLEMQDHYVKAHTLKGATMILMRLKDAIAELDGVEGMQVHRSWWVAREHVRGVERDGRKIGLELANGMVAPVSRNRQADLKTAGWI